MYWSDKGFFCLRGVSRPETFRQTLLVLNTVAVMAAIGLPRSYLFFLPRLEAPERRALSPEPLVHCWRFCLPELNQTAILYRIWTFP